jgi:hypothetical protein
MAVRRTLGIQLAAALAVAALAVVLWGGYGRHWRWTGFEHNATLWDWLELLALPLALAVAPLWLRHRARLRGAHKVAFGGAIVAFAVLVVLGYTLDLSWTGFGDNKLWDWLELLALPLAVALLPVWLEASSGFRRRHGVGATIALLALAVTVVGGYWGGWSWTGFEGNTLFDWLHLFVAPLLLPLVLVPLASAWVAATLTDDRAAR